MHKISLGVHRTQVPPAEGDTQLVYEVFGHPYPAIMLQKYSGNGVMERLTNEDCEGIVYPALDFSGQDTAALIRAHGSNLRRRLTSRLQSPAASQTLDVYYDEYNLVTRELNRFAHLVRLHAASTGRHPVQVGCIPDQLLAETEGTEESLEERGLPASISAADISIDRDVAIAASARQMERARMASERRSLISLVAEVERARREHARMTGSMQDELERRASAATRTLVEDTTRAQRVDELASMYVRGIRRPAGIVVRSAEKRDKPEAPARKPRVPFNKRKRIIKP